MNGKKEITLCADKIFNQYLFSGFNKKYFDLIKNIYLCTEKYSGIRYIF
jgi:hypothetical protein